MAVSRTKQRSRTSRNISRTARSRNRDRALVSDEGYEVEYLHKRFPRSTHRQVVNALEQCKDELKTDDRQKLMKCLKSKLGPKK